MTRVLGTRVVRATDDARSRTILLSDLHLRPDGGAALEAFELVLADARARPGETRVVVLGDLFDLYVSDRQLALPRWDEVARALLRTTAAGVPVTVLHGNRDFLLGRGFARRTGCRLVRGGLLLELAGLRTLCLHGDELCVRDLAYQRAKRLLRSPPVRVLARLLPLSAASGFGGRVRAKSQGQPRADDPARYDAAAEAVGTAFAAARADVLVFGHVHRAAHHPAWPDGGELWILPAFDEGGVHLVHDDGRFRVRAPGGAELAGFPARPLV